MKITIIGAAGVRTPLIIQAISKRQDKLGLSELSLMDIDGKRLELIGAISRDIEQSSDLKFTIQRTTDPKAALANADFVITTFRVGGIESRVIDERVPLKHGILGQETTGAGGFAMGIRSIPVILNYVRLMEEVCPDAWLINFANPAGMLTEAVVRNSAWRRVAGICDAPSSMHRVISAVLQADPAEVYLDYFGLNHLGWIKRVMYQQQDKMPQILEIIRSLGRVPGLPFDAELITSLKMIPNEYLYYYYYASQAVINILASKESRGEQIARQNRELYDELKDKQGLFDIEGMVQAYRAYLGERGSSYMVKETGKIHELSALSPEMIHTLEDEGYAGVALNLIESLHGKRPRVQILNIPNEGSIIGMDTMDVVEIPALVSHDHIKPLAVGEIPLHCSGLVNQVKDYEHLTIQAAVEGSYSKACLALTCHPLVRDFSLAKIILDEYIQQHHGYFPALR